MALEKNEDQTRPSGVDGVKETPYGVTTNASTKAPRPSAKGPEFSLGRRFGVGVNVAVMVVAAAALIIVVNVISYFQNFRRDLSSLGRYSLSDRTRQVVKSIKQPVTLSIIYDSHNPEKDRNKYQPAVWDLAEEIKSLGANVKVEDIATPGKRSEFAARIERQRGPAAGDYTKLVAEFLERGKGELKKQLEAEQARLADLVNEEKSWVRQFAQVQQAFLVISSMVTDLDKTGDDVRDLAGSGGMLVPYDKQADLIKKFVEPSIDSVKQMQKAIDNLAQLAKKMKGDDGGVSAKSKELAGKVAKEFTAVTAMLSAKGAASQPDAAKQFSQVAVAFRKVSELLAQEAALLKAFADDQPAVRGMPGWNPRVQTEEGVGRVPLERFFAGKSANLQDIASGVDAMSSKLTPAALKENLPHVVAAVADARAELDALFGAALAAIGSMGNIDAKSQDLLNQGADFLAPVGKELEELKARLGKLPELKGGGMADKLKGDNLVVVEVGGAEPRVLDFAEVWPEVAGLEPEMGPMDKKREVRRTFNGDSAIGSALLSASQDQIAEVVFVHYAPPQPPPQMRQQQPDEGDLPLSQLNTLRERLAKANLKVTEWNLAQSPEPPPPAYPGQDDKDKKPATQPASGPDKAPLSRVYVVLPPPPASNPQMGGGGQSFGLEQVRAVDEALQDGGRALFLTAFTMPRMNPFMPPMTAPYGWNQYLRNEWGLTVLNEYRLIQGIPDSREEGKFGLSQEKFSAMPLNMFKEGSQIGEPLRARRILLGNVAPIQIKDRPAGVTYETLLSVPMSNRTIWATRNVRALIYQLLSGEGGKVTINTAGGDMLPPLDVMIEATREPREGQTHKSEIVVFAGGFSLSDYFLQQQMYRTGAEGQVIPEPPPEVNAEVAINSIYWLAGQSKWIASGPVVIPPIKVPEARLLTIQAMVIGIWPALVLVFGLAIWMYRRGH